MVKMLLRIIRTVLLEFVDHLLRRYCSCESWG